MFKSGAQLGGCIRSSESFEIEGLKIRSIMRDKRLTRQVSAFKRYSYGSYERFLLAVTTGAGTEGHFNKELYKFLRCMDVNNN